MPRKPSIDLGERGKLSPYNTLNDLTGKEWIKFTKSWFHHNPKARKNNEILHPAKYPESLVEEFITFFTRKGNWVFDPFLGTASTLIAAGDNERNGVGIEITKKYLKISIERIKEKKYSTELTPLLGSSLSLKKVLDKKGYGKKKFDFVHVHNLPDILVLSALVPRLTGAKIILDMHEIMPEFFPPL